MATTELLALQSAIDYLRDSLMNFDSKEDGSYTDEELLKCQAFVVFSHAEVEVYLEKVSRKIMNSARKNWLDHTIYSRVISALVAFRRQQNVFIPEDPKVCTNNNDIEKMALLQSRARVEAGLIFGVFSKCRPRTAFRLGALLP